MPKKYKKKKPMWLKMFESMNADTKKSLKITKDYFRRNYPYELGQVRKLKKAKK